MQTYFCAEHRRYIVAYERDEEHLFIDDNAEEVAIFHDSNDKPYLKRYILGKCDEHCDTIKTLIGEE